MYLSVKKCPICGRLPQRQWTVLGRNSKLKYLLSCCSIKGEANIIRNEAIESWNKHVDALSEDTH